MSIGEVIALLSPEFPDVSVSKLRLWESEGLVEPARTASGYRKFSHQDVERLRYAMTLQRERYWPLRKIRDHLDAVSRGAEEPLLGAAGLRAAPDADGDGPPEPVDNPLRGNGPVRLSAAELCARSRLDVDELEALVGFGLLAPSGSGWYDANALTVAVAAAELSRFGIQARHLRSFRTAADREVGLVEQVVSPLRPGSSSGRGRADEAAQEVAAAALRLHAALVRSGLTRAGLG